MEPIIKYYTVADLKQWLIHNKPAEGLSERIIAPQRAYAIMNNPFVNDDDAVLCAIFEDGEPAAYTAAFPEVLERPKHERIWWFTTLYCRPESTGKGYGLIVVGTLAEIYGVENCFDMDGAAETIDIFKYLGHNCSFVQRYVFDEKHIKTGTIKGGIAYGLHNVKKIIRKRKIIYLKKLITNIDYTVSYFSHIDDNVYKFICDHSSPDCFVRKQEMFDWILQYPFLISSPLFDRVERKIAFSSNVNSYHYNAVKVLFNDKIIGFYMYRMINRELSLTYLYFSYENRQTVFSSIAETFVELKATCIKTTCKEFAEWFNQFSVTEKFKIERQSFSYPKSFCFDDRCLIQQGDGDVFV